MEINIGINKADRKAIADALAKVLADTYVLYQKTHAYHWNVTGPMFSSLHALFMTQYTELHDAADIIAERIRALGHFAPGSYTKYGKLSSISEDEEDAPAALDMVQGLVEGHETLTRTARSAFRPAEKAGDQPTMDLLAQRMEASEKAAWMLRSHLA
ncbi:MAG: DNA starvation/stationary phase protection protein [Alphaproteobacteria bacterium]|nr:DNA starvation/stationary phase protection protein [Alphaproteobacteria bacterium]